MLQRFINYLRGTLFVAFIIRIAQRIVLPGFQKIPLYDVAAFFFKGMSQGSISMRASSVAFNFFLAIFPFVIFIFTLLAYLPIDNFQERLLGLLSSFMPHNAYEAVKYTIQDIITNQRGGLLSIGFLSAIYFSTNGFHSLITAFNSTYHEVEMRTPFQQRWVSLLLVAISTLLLIIATGLIISSEIALRKIFDEGQFLYYLILLGRWVILFALFYCLVSFTYFLGPSRKTGWRFASAGSMFAAILSVVTSVGFASYVNNFGTYNKIYGSIGTLIVALLWLYFNALVLLLGFELNASIYQAKQFRPGEIGKNPPL